MEQNRIQIEKELCLVNDIIRQAVYHGGDFGGPYNSNLKQLNSAVLEYLAFRGLDQQYTTDAAYFEYGDAYIGNPPDDCVDFAIGRLSDDGKVFTYLSA